MKKHSWFSLISNKQRVWLFTTIGVMFLIIAAGFIPKPSKKIYKPADFNTTMSIKEMALKLGITRKSFARELSLPLHVRKGRPVKTLGVTDERLHHVVEHILSHTDITLKYYIYAALVLGSLVFLVRLGRPDDSGVKDRKSWYPRAPYIIFLLISVVFAGFVLGKSPNPMEAIVKVFKSMVGLYSNPIAKVIALSFFIILAIVGNKIICGWACPFGSLQELTFSLPILRKIKKKKIPFVLTNSLRAVIFITMLLFLFGIVGGRKGFVIYHFVNPFNLFDLDFSLTVIITIVITLLLSLFMYRPFCQLICPFGFVSWMVERFSIFRVRVDKNICTQCGACENACPTEAAKGIVAGNKMPADCFSCSRCLTSCPVDAIKYTYKIKQEKHKICAEDYEKSKN